jgi:hypothetical protein
MAGGIIPPVMEAIMLAVQDPRTVVAIIEILIVTTGTAFTGPEEDVNTFP